MKYQLPLYTFFTNLRKHPDFELGLNEYFELISVLEQDISYLQSSEKLLELCQLLWFKPQQSYTLFKRLFRESFSQKENEIIPSKKDNNLLPPPNPIKPVNPLPEPNVLPSEQKDISLEKAQKTLYLHFAESEAHATTDNETQKIKSDFRLDTHYVPFSERQFEQQWSIFPKKKYLNQHNTEIDINKTIQQLTQKGLLIDFVYQAKTYNPKHIIVLIDAGISMLAFNTWAAFIAKSLSQGAETKVNTYYCSFPPESYQEAEKDYYLYDRAIMLKPLKMKEQIAYNKNSVFLIISDAGASLSLFNNDSINQTLSFINTLKEKYTNKIVWLNPMPQDRWAGTNASPLSKAVKMYHTDIQGIKQAAKVLSGKRKTI